MHKGNHINKWSEWNEIGVIKHQLGVTGRWATRGTLTTQIKTNGFCEPCITEICVGMYLSK